MNTIRILVFRSFLLFGLPDNDLETLRCELPCEEQQT